MLEQKHSHIQTKIAESHQVSKNSLENKNKGDSASAITQQKADDLDYTRNLISSRQEKLQLLTIVPKTRKRKVCKYFGVNPYTVKQARELLNLNRILIKPSSKRGKTIADEVVFCNNNYSRLIPGEKDFFRVQKNIHEQKHLSLCNLSELYSNFKQDFPEVKIYFSKFCSLRAK